MTTTHRKHQSRPPSRSRTTRRVSRSSRPDTRSSRSSSRSTHGVHRYTSSLPGLYHSTASTGRSTTMPCTPHRSSSRRTGAGTQVQSSSPHYGPHQEEWGSVHCQQHTPTCSPLLQEEGQICEKQGFKDCFFPAQWGRPGPCPVPDHLPNQPCQYLHRGELFGTTAPMVPVPEVSSGQCISYDKRDHSIIKS